MALTSKWAAGKRAWAICDICGLRCRYLDLREPSIMGHSTGLKVCPTCYDSDHPQNFLPKFIRVDAEALRGARPDTGLMRSRWLPHWRPADSIALKAAVGSVEVKIT
jgi:hypothetical protein